MTAYTPDPWDAGHIEPPFRPTRSRAAMDVALRGFRLRVLNTIAGGLALTGIVACAAAASGLD